MAKDMTGNLITFGLLGAGGYLLYTYGQREGWFNGETLPAGNGTTSHPGGPVQTGNGSTQGPQAGSGVQDSTPEMASGTSALINIKQQLTNVAGAGKRYNPWQWSYFVENTLGINTGNGLDPYTIDPALAGYSIEQVENTAYTLDEWWSLAAPVIARSAGISGIGGLGKTITTGELAASVSGYYGIPGLAGPRRLAGGATHNNANYAGSTGMPSYGVGGLGTLERARKIETEITYLD